MHFLLGRKVAQRNLFLFLAVLIYREDSLAAVHIFHLDAHIRFRLAILEKAPELSQLIQGSATARHNLASQLSMNASSEKEEGEEQAEHGGIVRQRSDRNKRAPPKWKATSNTKYSKRSDVEICVCAMLDMCVSNNEQMVRAYSCIAVCMRYPCSQRMQGFGHKYHKYCAKPKPFLTGRHKTHESSFENDPATRMYRTVALLHFSQPHFITYNQVKFRPFARNWSQSQ